ncbi:MAG: porin [Stenotrophomonas nitritireducens]|uniref:OprO/OprP family phosphate-selective porin n=1 Tax=Stenotrophomonas nitritireducens TaxID=83617 RepID=UPI001AC6120C|nr:porin [Stenotrophomonas nitritireducens]MBN8768888.1 porin [Stenotrophomonas sp.]MBN8792926.1 porin [Stenotrophomonas nitritireducens]
MRRLAPLALLTLAAPAFAGPQAGAWPPKLTSDNGTETSLTGNFAWDVNRFAADGGAFEDDQGWRRKEFGVAIKRKGLYDFSASYDFQSDTWMDVALRLESKGLTGRDLGRWRIGQMKLPLGLEGNTATRNGAFMENALPTQAFYEGRRIGVDWALERPRWLFNAGAYSHDLQGNNRGDSLAARLAWTPRKQAAHVLHLGVSATREHPDAETNGLGVEIAPSVRWRAKPEVSLTPLRLVDSGTLRDVARIERRGLEALWIEGPWSLQGEYLQQTTHRHGLADYRGEGWYLAGSWLLTGESRAYSGGNVANPKPAGKRGAVELLARYSRIDLDDGLIRGGNERNLTLGANWYLGPHLKFQANYVRADARRGALHARPEALQLRAQFHF